MRIKKKIACLCCAFVLAVAALFCGCSDKRPRDGVNGKDLNIYDLYEAAKTIPGNEDLTLDEFLHEYLSYTDGELSEQISLRAAINRSLLSSVSVISEFNEPVAPASYQKVERAGSGVIIDDSGKEEGNLLIATNCHVVYSAQAASLGGNGLSNYVRLWLYGSEYSVYSAIPAKIVAVSKTYDIALLQVSGSSTVKNSQARAAAWSQEEECFLGETVYAIGNTGGDGMSATVGNISKDYEKISVNLGTAQNEEVYEYGVIRTTAAINSGNSGGGLFNSAGELVGLVSAKSAETDGVAGYAQPASCVRRVISAMLDQSGVSGGVKTVNHHIKVKVTDSYCTGLNENGLAEIKEIVTVKSAAGKYLSKLSDGDVLTHVTITRGGQVVEDMEIEREHNFRDVMLSVREGDSVTITGTRVSSNDLRVTVQFDGADFSVKQ